MKDDLIERTEAAIGLAKLAGQNRMCHVSLTYLTEVITALREQEHQIKQWMIEYDACQKHDKKLQARITELEASNKKIGNMAAEKASECGYLKAKIEQYDQLLESVLSYHEDDEEFCENLTKDINRIRGE